MLSETEQLTEEVKKLREQLAAKDKPKEPAVIKYEGQSISGVSLQDLASGAVKVDMKEQPPVLDLSKLTGSLEEIASGGGGSKS